MTRMRTFVSTCWLLGGLAALLFGSPALALDAKPVAPAASLGEKEFFKPELQISSSHVRDIDVVDELPNKDAVRSMVERLGGRTQLWFDPRSGHPSSVITRVPMIPGRGNDLTLADVAQRVGRSVDVVDSRVLADSVRNFVIDNREALGLDITQLGTVRAKHVAGELWHITIPQLVSGIPVRHAYFAATVSHGNLVLAGAETWANVRIDTQPRITAEQAVELGFAHIGGKASTDELWKKTQLEIVPVAPPERQIGEAFVGPVGTGYGHRLVWAFGFERKDDYARWELLVDAHTGEVVSFEDRNHYESKKISGGIYPLTSTGICPTNDTCGTMQADSPMPWANTGLPAPNDFTNSAGIFEYPGSGLVTTTLVGRYVRIVDSCGAISNSASGDIDMAGVNNDHDCVTGGGSAGNTPASRSAFYEVNKLSEMARGWLPSNTWLTQPLLTNVNLNQTCNAFWNGTSINFYRSGGGCRNTGEIAAVFDHEWGHGLDDNDTGGALSSSSEAYADIAAIYRLQASCVGYGFFQTIDDGCGMTADGTGFNANESQNGLHCVTNCSGVRDSDWGLHADNTPDTPLNFVCGECGSGSGPCGRQVHCSAAPSRQAAWDLAARDLQAPPFNMSSNDAFIVANKVFYQGSGIVGSWHACTCPTSSSGCGATNAYLQWLAADDDNGDLTDGTPHMTAIFAAFDRHEIACPTPTPQNGGCAGGPTDAPALTASAGSNQVALNWTPVAGAVTYRVLRTEGYAGCDFGKAVIAEIPGTSYNDPDTANGRDYSYVVQAVGSTGACFGPSSACVTVAPQPCAGAVSVDGSTYNCTDTVTISLVDSDLIGAGNHLVAVSSTTETTPEALLLTESPANSGRFVGTIDTTPASPASDGLLSVAHADTISVEYVDASYCGTPDVSVTRTAGVDCQGPTISNVRAENVTGRSAEIKWSTDEGANSQVDFGLTPPPEFSTLPTTAFVTNHTVLLDGLGECSQYVFSVSSSDPAGNSSSDDQAGAFYAFETGKNVNPVYRYGGEPVAIPDNSTTGASVSVTVPDVNVIVDVDVFVTVTHTYTGDLILSLIGPDNVSRTLSNRRGGGGDNFIETAFDDEAATPISGGTAPFTGTFRPDQTLSIFDGINPTGTWTFKVVDAAGADIGTIDAFELRLSYPPQACGPSLRVQSHSLNDTCDAGAGGGNLVVEPGETVSLPVALRNDGTDPTTGVSATLSSLTPGVVVLDGSTDYPDLPSGSFADGDAPFAIYVGPSVACGSTIQLRVDAMSNEGAWTDYFSMNVGSPGSAVTTYAATDLPKPLPDVSTTTSTLTVPSSAAVADVDVEISLTHTYTGDLDIFLVDPHGIRVELSTDNGGSGDNYTGTIFDDEAATSIINGTAPFTGRFRPEVALTILDGLSPLGNWTLEITDDAGADVGTFLAWSLTLTTTAPPTCQTCESIVAPGAVASVWWSSGDKNRLEWTAAAGATSYNLYRGEGTDLPALLDASPDSCLLLVASGLDSGATLGDDPQADKFFWFLVRAVNGIGEGSPGSGTAGERVQDSYGACP